MKTFSNDVKTVSNLNLKDNIMKYIDEACKDSFLVLVDGAYQQELSRLEISDSHQIEINNFNQNYPSSPK